MLAALVKVKFTAMPVATTHFQNPWHRTNALFTRTVLVAGAQFVEKLQARSCLDLGSARGHLAGSTEHAAGPACQEQGTAWLLSVSHIGFPLFFLVVSP